jgi:23S rRNA (guanosine2251-2'-O)-methyltransferase
MAGNSSRRGARRTTSKRGPTVGTGGKNREGLKGRGKTLPADERPWHKGYSGDEPLPRRTAWKQEKEKRAAEAKRPAAARGGGGRRVARVVPGRRSTPPRDGAELLVGRNPVLEALRTHIPATALHVAHGIEVDDRMTEIIRTAADRGLPVLEVSRGELDRMTGGVLHQGVGLQVPPFAYEPFDDLLAAAIEAPTPPLLVGLDGVTDPRNLGAVVRSAAAFGAHGVFLPERRSAGMTATAWRTSAGAAARIPISQVTNLTRSIKRCQQEGFLAVGLDADGPTTVYDLEAAVGALVIVVGSEGRGLSRLVGETCDLRVRIPTTSAVESLNASVAAAVTLAEVARRRFNEPAS